VTRHDPRHWLVTLLLAASGGCGLVADLGPRARDAGTAGIDAEPGLDAPGLDAPGLDAPDLDAEPEDDAEGEDVGLVDRCLGRPDGAACSEIGAPRAICLGGLCTPSTCGDGFVDWLGGEVCDPMTDRDCVDCARSCVANLECATGTPCLIGTCDRGVCSFTARSGTCNDGSIAGVCRGFVCAPASCGDGILQPDEDCDVGPEPTRGCRGCRFECTGDGDCDDGDACNGTEACFSIEEAMVGVVARYCVPSTPTCVSDACFEARCETDAGGAARCTRTPRLDADEDGYSGNPSCPLPDCRDDLADVHPGAPERCNDVDDDCDGFADEGGMAWCLDRDGDGYGDPSTMMSNCGAMPGYVADCSDCWDSSDPLRVREARLVNPGQTSFFATAYCVAPGDCRFDYDCDREEELQLPTEESCELLDPPCALGSGWAGTPPACGASGRYVSCSRLLFACVSSRETIVQHCR
jgi:hypothetical protein